MSTSYMNDEKYQRWLQFLSERYAVPTERWTEAPDDFLRTARTAIESGLPAKIIHDPDGKYHVFGCYSDDPKKIIYVLDSESMRKTR